jgi:hypothetical protein
MVIHRSLPYAEFLSFNAPARWKDFEWLTQLIFFGAYNFGGFALLWALKAVLVWACWRFFDAALKLNGLPPSARAVALVVWAAPALAWSDIRPELFSMLLFSACLWRLEAVRLGLVEPGARLAVEAALAFALWANLHAGFPFGLVLIAIYGVGELILGRASRALALGRICAAGALGALLTPFGFGEYGILWEHFRSRGDLARYIQEWAAPGRANPLHWPTFALTAVAAVFAGGRLAEPASLQARWRRPVPWAPILAAGHFAANALLHARLAAFFGVIGALLCAVVAGEDRAWLKRAWLGVAAAAALFILWLLPRVQWTNFFNPKFVPVRAAEFMARQEPVLAPLRLYNEWGWGGYLAWRLRPWQRVFTDGRYVFHAILREESRATESPENWQGFLSVHRLNGALVPNRHAMLPSRRRYPDGREKSFDRPWYLSYFPRERWALVYWDDQAMLFLERRAMPQPWLSEHEYRWLRPRDEAAFDDARSRGEIPAHELKKEAERHAAELSAPSTLR